MRPSVAVLYPHVPLRGQRQAGREAGADIAYSLVGAGVRVITRRDYPRAGAALDWVFADSVEGVRAARAAGAEVLWLPTMPTIEDPSLRCGARIVGQAPGLVEPPGGARPEAEADLFLLPGGGETRCLSAARRIEVPVAAELEAAALELASRLNLRAPIHCEGGRGPDGKYQLFNFDFSPSLAGGERRKPAGVISPLVAAAAAQGITHPVLLLRLFRQAWLPNA